MVAALVLTGGPGTGKSSALEALTTRLERDGIAYGALETEQLAWGSPWLAPAAWLPQLAAVLELQKAAGRRLFLLGATAETTEELRGIVAAAGAERVLVAALTARPETVAARIGAREPDDWPGKPALVANARRLARAVPALDGVSLVIDTDERGPGAVAAELHDALREHGLCARPR